MKRFAAFDIDGTIFRWQLYHELFDALVTENVISPADATKVLTAREDWRKRERSYHEYEDTLVAVMEASIVGLDSKKFQAIADEILQKKGHHVYTYTMNLLKQLQAEGYTIIAISASHQQLVDAFCRLHTIDIAIGRQYQVVRGKVTAKTNNTVYGNKHHILQEIVERENLVWEDSYAVGDSSGDITMLELVAHPIAFNPDDTLREMAMEQGWPIVLERKSIAYKLEKGTDGTYVLAETIRS